MSIGQLLLLSGYLALTIGLGARCSIVDADGAVFGGSQSDIDWYAHHSAMLCFAQLPLIIGACATSARKLPRARALLWQR